MIDFYDIFESLPGCYLILSPPEPDFIILHVNKAYLTATNTTKDIIGRPLFEVFPDNPDDTASSGVKNLTASLMKVLQTKKQHEMPIQRYDTKQKGHAHFTMHYWKPLNIPVLNADNTVRCIIQSVKEVTDEVLLKKDIRSRDNFSQQQIADAILTTQELERIEISQELHDNVNQILNTSRLYLERASQSQPPEARFLKMGHALIEKAMEEVSSLSSALLQTSTEEHSIIRTLEELLGHVMELNQINVFKKIQLPDEALIEAKVKTTIIRIMQEHLTNVVKHAEAKNLYIDLSFKDGKLELTIKDDGRGFDMMNYKKGKGLQNIRSRAAIMDGQVQITSYPGDGCQISVLLPIKES